MAAKPKVLCVGDPSLRDDSVIDHLQESYDVVEVNNSVEALARLVKGSFASVLIYSDEIAEKLRVGSLLQSERILEGMPDGLVLLDEHNTVFWANDWVSKWSALTTTPDQAADGNGHQIVGRNFYDIFHSPEILGPDVCPFGAALATRRSRCTTLRCDENNYFQVHAVPVNETDAALPATTLIVTIRDVTTEMLQQQKLAAIHKAGIELADLTTEEVFNMEVEDRIELLKSNILHYTKDLLNYDVVEIRLLGADQGDLMPLLSVGIIEEAAKRPLVASPTHSTRTGDRHVQRRKPRASRILPKRSAIFGDLFA